MARQTIGPATLGQNSAPLEGYGAASVQTHLARGSIAPSSGDPSRSRVESFNALTPAGVRVKGESTPLSAWESCPSTAPPTPATMRHYAAWSAKPPRGTVPPTPVRLAHRILERGQRNPRRDDAPLLCARTGRRRDVRPAGTVFSVTISPVRPSLPLQCHFNATPATAPPCPMLWKHAETGHRHANHCTLYGFVSMAPWNPHADGPRTSNLYATPLEAAPGDAQYAP
jgi:hypothetical protein